MIVGRRHPGLLTSSDWCVSPVFHSWPALSLWSDLLPLEIPIFLLFLSDMSSLLKLWAFLSAQFQHVQISFTIVWTKQHGSNFSYHSILTMRNCLKYKLSLLALQSTEHLSQKMHIRIITSHIPSKSVSDGSLCILIHFALDSKCVVVLSPHLPVKNPCNMLQKWITERTWLTRMNCYKWNWMWLERLENVDSKVKLGWDLGLCEVMVQSILKNSYESYTKVKSLQLLV